MKKHLTPYLVAGATAAAAGQANAATVVTFYGPGAQSPSTDPATPVGIDFGLYFPNFYALDSSGGAASSFGYQNGGGGYFTAGTDLTPTQGNGIGLYVTSGSFDFGAAAGNQNYANISFDGDDDIYEAVGQFFFDGAGGGYLVALAINDDDTALSISAGKAAIDAIPEPTTAGLLALGAAGLAMLRRKKSA